VEHLILEYLLNIFIISQDKISLLKFFGWVMFKIKVPIMEYLVLEYLLNIIISEINSFSWVLWFGCDLQIQLLIIFLKIYPPAKSLC
jgi:hypothetical protein